MFFFFVFPLNVMPKCQDMYAKKKNNKKKKKIKK